MLNLHDKRPFNAGLAPSRHVVTLVSVSLWLMRPLATDTAFLVVPFYKTIART